MGWQRAWLVAASLALAGCAPAGGPPAPPPAEPPCFRREAELPWCKGVPPPPEWYAAPRETGVVCDACRDDRHCTAAPGGRCLVESPGQPCHPPRFACVYPGDACWTGSCPDGHCAAHDGRLVCRPGWPPRPP